MIVKRNMVLTYVKRRRGLWLFVPLSLLLATLFGAMATAAAGARVTTPATTPSGVPEAIAPADNSGAALAFGILAIVVIVAIGGAVIWYTAKSRRARSDMDN